MIFYILIKDDKSEDSYDYSHVHQSGQKLINLIIIACEQSVHLQIFESEDASRLTIYRTDLSRLEIISRRTKKSARSINNKMTTAKKVPSLECDNKVNE